MNEQQLQALLDKFADRLLGDMDKRMDARFKERDDAAAKKAEEEAKKREEEEKKKALEADKLKAAEEKVKADKLAKTTEEQEKQRMMDAFKFNSLLKDFLKDNKDFLPDTLEDIINILEAKTYANDIEKAQELKRAVIEQYIKNQANIDLLPDSLKSKAEKYAGLTTKEKLEQAPNFYDIVETGIHTAKNVKKAEAIGKGGGLNDGDEKTATKEYEEKMLQFSKDAINGTSDKGGDGK